MDIKEWVRIEESLFKTQLITIREFFQRKEESTSKADKNARSQMSITSDLLRNSPILLHLRDTRSFERKILRGLRPRQRSPCN